MRITAAQGRYRTRTIRYSRILEKVEEFIDSSALPSETKRLLKVMLLSEGDGELFLSTIRKLELEESLQRHLQIK